MNIWLIMPILLFSGIALLMYLEKRAIIKQPGVERKILVVHERRPLWKIAGYMILAGIILFAIQPQTVTVSMAFFKLSLICSIFFLDSIMKTKLYISDKRIYLIERFRNNNFVHIKEMNPEDIYNVEASKHYPGLYYLHYFTKKNKAIRLKLYIGNIEQREMFKSILKQRMNINILREAEHERINEFKRNENGLDVFSKFFIWLSFVVIIGAIWKSTKDSNGNLSETEHVITYLFASLFIPLALYFFSYFFILTSGIIKKLNIVSVKTVALTLILASSSIPFYQLMKTGKQTNNEFIEFQLAGLALFGVIIFCGFLLGMITKVWQEKRRHHAKQKATSR